MLARKIAGSNLNFRHAGAPRQGAVLIMLYPDDRNWWFPLMQRPTYNGVHSGQISLPGGRMEREDSDLIVTALRETREELGVSVNENQVLGCLTELYITASHYKVLPVVAMIEQRPRYQPDLREVQQVFEVNTSDLQNINNRKSAEIEVRGIQIEAPHFTLQDQMVWGATAMILNEFLSVLKKVH